MQLPWARVHLQVYGNAVIDGAPLLIISKHCVRQHVYMYASHDVHLHMDLTKT